MCIRDSTHTHTFQKMTFLHVFRGSTMRISPYLERDLFRDHHTSISLRNVEVKRLRKHDFTCVCLNKNSNIYKYK